jgi:peptidoglycan/xylan/chitin deacetylase (PgdA/CDA1 family)
VTFDDGYADNFIQALPILEEFNIPATFFVTTGYLDSEREFWWDDLERLLLADRVYPADFRLEGDLLKAAWRTTSRAELRLVYREVQKLMKGISPPERDVLLEQIQQWGGCEGKGRENYLPLKIAELRQLAKSEWADIGAHGTTHAQLSSRAPDDQRREILESKQQLESCLGQPITLFSYPFGGRDDYTSETVSFLRESGFHSAVANYPGQVHRWSDQFQLPRHLVRNWPIDLFRRHFDSFWYL